MDEIRSQDTSDEYPVDARALTLRPTSLRDQEEELARLEERASEVERALRKVDQEILSLEYAASIQDGNDRVRYVGPSESEGGNLTGRSRVASNAGSIFSNGTQQVVINNYHQPVNQTYHSENRMSGGLSPRSSLSARRRTTRNRSSGASRTGPAAPSISPRGSLLLLDDTPSETGERRSRRHNRHRSRQSSGGASVRLQLEEDPRRSHRFDSSPLIEEEDELHEFFDDYESVASLRDTRSQYSRRRGVPPSVRSRTTSGLSTSSGNVFRDISAIAKEKADDEEKDLLMAIKASIGFAAAMIGEALFLRLREWLDNAQPSPTNTGQTSKAPLSSEELAKLAAEVDAMVAANGDALRGKSAAKKHAPVPGHAAVERAKSDIKLRVLVENLAVQGKLREAEMLLRKALQIRRDQYGNEHPAVAHSLNQLGSLLSEQNKLEEAETCFQEALGICKAVYPENHPREALLVNNLAVLLLLKANDEDGELREQHQLDALALGHRAYEIAKASFGSKHPITVSYKSDWGVPDDESVKSRKQSAGSGILSKLSRKSRTSFGSANSGNRSGSSNVKSDGGGKEQKRKGRKSCVIQ